MQIKRLNAHLYAAITNVLLFLGELIFLILFIYILNQKISLIWDKFLLIIKSLFIIATVFVSFGIFFSIFFGIKQLKHEKDIELKYVGWLSIFCSIFLFPFFVNWTFWKKSGLTKHQIKIGIKKFNTEHIEEIVDVLNSQNKISPAFQKEFADLRELIKMELLDQHEIDEWIYDRVLSEIDLENIPVLYTQKQILENEVYK